LASECSGGVEAIDDVVSNYPALGSENVSEMLAETGAVRQPSMAALRRRFRILKRAL
jgi:hypothetical protein